TTSSCRLYRDPSPALRDRDFACGLPLSRFAGPAHARKTAQEGSFAPLRISPAGSRSPASRDPLTPAKRLKRDPSLRSGFRLRAPALPLRGTRSRPQNGSSLHLILQALPVHHREHVPSQFVRPKGL